MFRRPVAILDGAVLGVVIIALVIMGTMMFALVH
jgi:hypothetical protein